MGGQEEEEEEDEEEEREEDALTVGAFAALEWMIATAHLRRRITGLHEVNSVHGGRTLLWARRHLPAQGCRYR